VAPHFIIGMLLVEGCARRRDGRAARSFRAIFVSCIIVTQINPLRVDDTAG
jgi:hypothetical protein